MERIRIGNNIAISWAVYDLNGRIHNLEGKDIQLYMAVGGYKVYVNSYTIQGNVISWVFLGSEQTKTGDYKLVLEETDPLSGASAFDVRAAFRLTPEDVVGPDIVLGPANVSVQSVLTYSNLVGVESIDVVESSEDSGDNIVTIHLIDGSFAEVVIKNGSKGPKGDKGDTGATGPKGEKGDTGERGPVGVDTVNAAIGTNDPSQAPSVDKTFADGVLGLTFNNIKGAKGDKGDQGNTGSSVDYPYELVNNVTTDDATKGLSAAQGVVLDGKISQLGQEIDGLFEDGIDDFSISDEDGNDIVQFSKGHVKTKNFNSEKSPKTEVGPDDFSVSDDSGNTLAKFSKGHLKTLNFNSKNVLERIRNLESEGEVSTLDLYLPSYVFGIESGDSFGGREYFTSLYPEAMVKSLGINLKLNGQKKYNFQRTRWASNNYIHNVDVEEHSIVASAKGYKDSSFNINYVRANRHNAKNKPIRLLCIGDSITEQEQMDFYYGGKWNMVGAYPAWAQKLALEDNADIENISIDLLGTRYIHTHEWDYNGTVAATHHLTATTHDEGRRGWRIHTYMQSPIDFLDAQKTYYLSGLATKTPYDSNTPGQAYTSLEAYVGSHGWGGLYDLMYETPMGRYKPDWNAGLWELFKSFPAFTGTGDYDQSTSDALMASFWENILVNPKAILGDLTSTLDTTTCYINPFYDVTKARAYTGSHSWTNNNAFTFSKWLERYRTCDDLGVRLSGSAGDSVTGSDGEIYTIGTWVGDAATSPYEVYKPTHIILGVGINDEYTATGYGTAYESLLQAIVSYDNSIPIGYFMHRRAGVIEPQDWQDYGILTKKANIDYNRDSAMQALHPTLNISNQITYIPSYFTESAVAGSCARISYDFDDGIEVKKIVAGADNVHTSSFTQKSIGYQCLAWVYWTLQ